MPLAEEPEALKKLSIFRDQQGSDAEIEAAVHGFAEAPGTLPLGRHRPPGGNLPGAGRLHFHRHVANLRGCLGPPVYDDSGVIVGVGRGSGKRTRICRRLSPSRSLFVFFASFVVMTTFGVSPRSARSTRNQTGPSRLRVEKPGGKSGRNPGARTGLRFPLARQSIHGLLRCTQFADICVNTWAASREKRSGLTRFGCVHWPDGRYSLRSSSAPNTVQTAWSSVQPHCNQRQTACKQRRDAVSRLVALGLHGG